MQAQARLDYLQQYDEKWSGVANVETQVLSIDGFSGSCSRGSAGEQSQNRLGNHVAVGAKCYSDDPQREEMNRCARCS